MRMPKLRRQKKRRTKIDPFDLDHTLLYFSSDKRDRWTVRDACEGTQVFGATGSGKTSGSGRAIAHAFLRNGYGGLVLTAKPDEADLWRSYCEECGREDDLIVMQPGGRWKTNILDYEFSRCDQGGRGRGLADNIASLFSTVLELGRPGKSQSNSDPFWTDAVHDLVANAVELLGLAQVLMKLLWQRSAERRAASSVEESVRPVFLWADEAHNFVTPGDVMFQTTARSARACTVYLTQNISNYLDALGGVNAQAQTDALLGSLNTKLFHANSDPATNRWAAELFAQSHRFRMSTNMGQTDPSDPTGSGNATHNHGSGLTEQLEYEVPPATFKTLAMGGPDHNYMVEAIAFRTGRIWKATGTTDIRIVFSQQQRGKK